MLASWTRRTVPADTADRSAMSFNEYLSLVEPWLPHFTQAKSGDPEKANKTGVNLATRAYTGNGVVFACAAVRLAVFSQIELKWQDLATRKLYGNQALETFERPWAGGSQSQVFARMEQDATCAGNSFWYNAGSLVRSDVVNLARMDPHKVTIMSSKIEGRMGGTLGWAKAGYWFTEDEDTTPEWLELSEVAHYAPIPDPTAAWRGMSWLTPVLREVDVDNAFNEFKQSHLENAATPNLVVTFDPSVSPDQFKKLTEVIKRKMTGTHNAGKTLALGGGADVKVVGANFEQLALKAVQGAGETRIAAAAGVPSVVVGLSEGLSGSSLNEGNYGSARRRFADVTMRDAWQAAVNALATLEPAPAGSRLWYSDRDVSFLQEDVKDEANIREANARTIRQLIEAGFTPESATTAVIDGDFAGLKHTGLVSVQLQAPGTTAPDPARDAASMLLASAVERAALPAVVAPAERTAPDMHFHLPESVQVELRQDHLATAIERMADGQTSAADIATAVSAAIGALPAPIVNVTNEVPTVPVQLSLEMPAPVINVAPAQVTVNMPEDNSNDGPSTKTVKLKIGDRTVTGSITES